MPSHPKKKGGEKPKCNNHLLNGEITIGSACNVMLLCYKGIRNKRIGEMGRGGGAIRLPEYTLVQWPPSLVTAACRQLERFGESGNAR